MKDRKIRLACPACERKLKLSDSHIGKPIVCPKCNTRFKINNAMVAEVLGRGHQGSSKTLAQQDKEALGEPADAKAAFEDIDSLFTSDEIDSHAQQIESHARNNNRSDVANEWQKEKQVVSRGDERLGRNGIGLLIMSAGLALLPIFGASVSELSWVLPYLPIAAIAAAILGTFFLTYSKRRRGFGSLILSLFPLAFISLASGAGYLYIEYLNPTPNEEVAQEADTLEEEPVDQEVEFDDDLITIDRDSINQNPAAKFVPPTHDESSGDHKPSILANADTEKGETNDGENAEASAVENRPPIEGPRSTPKQAFEPFAPSPEPQFARAADKRTELRKRIDANRMKLLATKGQFRVPNDFDYSFSKIVGETTVYGFALQSESAIHGFDFLISSNNPTVEMVVPILNEAEFVDSQVVDAATQELVGVNIHRQAIGIVGLQAIFAGTDDGTSLGEWIGIAPEADNYMTVRSEHGKLAGFVMYRNGMRTVGFGLVIRP